jgi:hypothetical protein
MFSRNGSRTIYTRKRTSSNIGIFVALYNPGLTYFLSVEWESLEVIHMVDDQYNVTDKPDTELDERVASKKQRTAKYIADIQEILDRNEASARKRDLIATGIILVLAVTAFITISAY